jgi:acetyl-CoA carboxylase carboxyltransferase component
MEESVMSDKLKLSASERIATLLDDASFVEIGSEVTARATDFNESSIDTPKDGVVTGYGQIDGRLVYVYSQDASVLGGAIGEMHAKKISHIYSLAMKVGAPVIGLIDSAGLRLQEATDSLHSFGALYKKFTLASGVIPQITAIFGNAGGGAGVLTSLSDFTIMVDSAKLFVNSPNAIAGNYEEKLDTSSAEYVSAHTNMIDMVCADDVSALAEIRNLISFLPSNNDDFIDGTTEDDLNRTIPGIDGYVDDARRVIESIADDNIFHEIKKESGKDFVTGFIRLGGFSVAVVANQEKKMSAMGIRKAAGLVSFADAFNIPVLTFTNVDGYSNTLEDQLYISKAGAKLISAFAVATVPKVNVIIGDGFGSGYLMMNSKSVGADMVYAWPNAKVGAMDPKAAAEIIAADDIADSNDKVAAIKSAEEKIIASQSGAKAVARRGYVDDIIEPDATRKRLIAAFDMLATKSEDRPYKKHIAF